MKEGFIMAYGCDTATIVTTSRLNSIIAKGYKFIGRYLNYLLGSHDNISVEEAQRISDAGLHIVSIYQTAYTTDPTDFTSQRGTSDVTDAISLATNLGQPANTPIYFAVDCDATLSEIETYIVPYFQAIKNVLNDSSQNPNGYKMGIYGSRLVCGYIRGTYSPTERYTWVAAANWRGDFSDWNIKQTSGQIGIGSGSGYILVDEDESTAYGGGGWQV